MEVSTIFYICTYCVFALLGHLLLANTCISLTRQVLVPHPITSLGAMPPQQHMQQQHPPQHPPQGRGHPMPGQQGVRVSVLASLPIILSQRV